MGPIVLRNDAGVEISASLQERLKESVRELSRRVKGAGIDDASLSDVVAVLFVPAASDTSTGIVSLVPKSELVGYIAETEAIILRELRKSLGPDFKEGESLVPQRMIERCLQPLPPEVLRVLFISGEMSGTLQLHKNHLQDADVLAGEFAPNLGARALKLQKAVHEAEAYMDQPHKRIAQGIFEKVKDLPKEQALDVLNDAQLALSEDLIELRAHRAAMGEANEEMVQALLEQLPQFRERWKSVVARSKKVVVPPDTSSATNVETLLMAASYVFDPVTVDTKLSNEEVAFLIGHYSYKDIPITKILKRMEHCFRALPFSGLLQDFGIDWMRQGFPKLEVGQKLAASLALTDVPDDIEVVAPWKAWSLIVPPGLFGRASVSEGDFARLWCRGTEVLFVVMSKGGIAGPMTEEIINKMWAPEMNGLSKTIGSTRLTWLALNSLVKGACLALSNPDDYKRESLKDRHNKELKKQRDGEPDFAVSRFMLSAPVQIDLRQTLLDELAGKKRQSGGGSPTVQFFVRGHWRNQAHGPGRALRKTIRIEGFWKGPEEGRVLLRNYKVKEDENAKTPEGGTQDTQANPPSGG